MKELRGCKQILRKVFKFGYDKRVVKQINKDHIDTLPYGY